MQAGAGLYFEMETMQPITCRETGIMPLCKKRKGADSSGTGQVHREAGSLVKKKNQEKVKKWVKT